MIAAVAIATQASVLPQLVQPAGDFAAVVAADRLDKVGVEHRRCGERLLDVLKARGPFEDLGRSPGQRNLAVAAERLGAVKARLGSGPSSLERGVHGHSRNPLKDHEVLIGLETRSERPFDLLVVADVDVLVEYEDVLEPPDAAEQRRD